mgnify:FL=1
MFSEKKVNGWASAFPAPIGSLGIPLVVVVIPLQAESAVAPVGSTIRIQHYVNCLKLWNLGRGGRGSSEHRGGESKPINLG